MSLHSLYPLFVLSLFLFYPFLCPPFEALPTPTFAKCGFRAQYNRIRDPQAGEGRQPTRQVVMVYILFHPVILANDKDGSSNKSRGRRMLDTENVTRISFLRAATPAPREYEWIESFRSHKYGEKLVETRKRVFIGCITYEILSFFFFFSSFLLLLSRLFSRGWLGEKLGWMKGGKGLIDSLIE